MDISQESDPKSQDEISVRSSFGKNFESYVRERYLKKISVVGVYRVAIPSEKFSRRMFASYRGLELDLLFSIYTKKQFEKFGYVSTASLVSGFVASVQGKEIQKSAIMVKSENSKI